MKWTSPTQPLLTLVSSCPRQYLPLPLRPPIRSSLHVTNRVSLWLRPKASIQVPTGVSFEVVQGNTAIPAATKQVSSASHRQEINSST